jgi:hypothetical protein
MGLLTIQVSVDTTIDLSPGCPSVTVTIRAGIDTVASRSVEGMRVRSERQNIALMGSDYRVFAHLPKITNNFAPTF